MEKILIIGCSGSGKSTLARQLKEKLGLPVVHLDQLWWQEGWQSVSREEFDARSQIYRKELADTGSGKIRIGKDLQQRIHACLVPWEELDDLSARENAITGKSTDYKEMDRNNVRAIPAILRASRPAGEI